MACAEAWRGDGEILASPIGLIPAIGAQLARATFAPDLLLTDGEALLGQGTWAIGARPTVIEGWLPYRAIFDLIYNGQRHVMMSPSQIDARGNVNISAIGDFGRPKAALLGVRGAPGNTVNFCAPPRCPAATAVRSGRILRPGRVGESGALAAAVDHQVRAADIAG